MFYHSRPYIIECSLNPYPLSFIDSLIKTLQWFVCCTEEEKNHSYVHMCAYFMNIEFINSNLNSSRPNLTFHVQYSLLVLRSRDYVWRFGTLLLLRWNIKLQKYRWMCVICISKMASACRSFRNIPILILFLLSSIKINFSFIFWNK